MPRLPLATTLHVRDRCLCLATQRAARTLAKRFDTAFREVGLTNGQFSVLMTLNQFEPPSLGSVADLLAMDRSTLTAALKPLERAGLVQVRVDDRDRRGRRLKLTTKGHQQLSRALPIWRREHAAIQTSMGPLQKLHHTLGQLTELPASGTA